MCRTACLSFSIILVTLCAAQQSEAIDTVGIAAKTAFPKAKQPQVAVDPRGKVYLVFGAENSVYCAISRDGGKSFGSPAKVAEAGVLPLGMRRGPRVAATDRWVVVTAIGGKEGHGHDENLFAWRSDDGGATWKKPVQINGVAASAREGLHHLAAAPDGTFYCTWLDLREKGTQVYGARSSDGGASWQDEKPIYRSPDGSVCQCCQPQVTFGPSGKLYVMWRNNIDGARDMYLVRSADNGRTFGAAEKLGHGTWPLDECPMDGGGLACDADGSLTTIWRREKQLFTYTPGHEEISIGAGAQGWAAAGPGGPFLVWSTGRPGAIFATNPILKRPQQLASRGSDPVVAGAVTGKGPIVAAWEAPDDDGYRIVTAVLSSAR